MKKIRKKCMFPDDTKPKMHTLYEYHGKLGTSCENVFWLAEIITLPKKDIVSFNDIVKSDNIQSVFGFDMVHNGIINNINQWCVMRYYQVDCVRDDINYGEFLYVSE